MKSIVERLNEFHLYLKGKGYGGRNFFETEIGKKPGYLTTALNRKSKELGSDVLEQLVSKFPELNIKWLLTGEGKMLNDGFYDDGFVYHYTTIEGLLGIFSSSYLKFSDFSHSDDLRERELFKMSGKPFKYICFCYGEEAYNKPAMWAKYALNDTGACIKFDLKKLLELNEGKGDFEHFKIKYVPSDFMKTGQDLEWMEYKNSDWAYQNEYRFISESMDHLHINQDCVKGVSFGKEAFGVSKDVVDFFYSAGLSNLSIFVRGEYVNHDFIGNISIPWEEMRLRTSELYKKLIDEENNNVKLVSTYMRDNLVRVQYVPSYAAASFVENLYDVENEKDYLDVIQEDGEVIGNDYLVFQVSGDSMEPTIPNGAKILARRIDEGRWEYADGVVVVVYNKILTVKRISKNMLFDNNSLILKADNAKHGEMTVSRSEIRGMWKAERIISQKIN